MTHEDSPVHGWTRVSPDAEESTTGCRVQAVRVGGIWRYCAWGPDQGNPWPRMVARYAIGAATPTRRVLLGCHATPAAARAACEAFSGPPRA